MCSYILLYFNGNSLNAIIYYKQRYIIKTDIYDAKLDAPFFSLKWLFFYLIDLNR